ncbi:hypothetical protein LEP1GSC188_3112 [Leptospira weilii serovar Topaz str. LT2116]|uniref:Uncharacterized protein n=1 Tax=Leptospira weilii serovar Topaz str. LT2116 TaxID=1088540 RepID=M3G4M0_9LEPT|nr:hypothetical protein LEP1GSC188_3112 [Leptospira weilii serovar Topaz str. LT2116]
MKSIDKLIEEELNNIFVALKERLQKETEDGIRKFSSKIKSHIAQSNQVQKDSKTLIFTKCPSCGSHYLKGYAHYCSRTNGHA